MDSAVSDSWLNGRYVHAVRKGFTEPVTALKLGKAASGDSVLAVGFSTAQVSLYRIPHQLSGELPLHFDDLLTVSIKAHASAVTAIYFDENLLISGDNIGNLRVFDLDTKFCLTSVSGHTTAITDIAFCPQSKLLVSASSRDGTIIFSSINGVSSLILKQIRVNSCSDILLAFDRTGEYLISCHGDSSLVCVWDARKKQKICEATCAPHSIDFMTVEYDRAAAPGSYVCTLVAACVDGYVAEWTFDGLSLRMEADLQYPFKSEKPSYLLVNRSSQCCIAGCKDGSVKVYNCDLYSDEMSLFEHPRYEITPSHTGGPVDLITGDENLLISVGSDNRINCFSFLREVDAPQVDDVAQPAAQEEQLLVQHVEPESQRLPSPTPGQELPTKVDTKLEQDFASEQQREHAVGNAVEAKVETKVAATAKAKKFAKAEVSEKGDEKSDEEEPAELPADRAFQTEPKRRRKSSTKDKDKSRQKEKSRHREKSRKHRSRESHSRVSTEADQMSSDELQSKIVSAICLALIAVGLLVYAVGPVLVV